MIVTDQNDREVEVTVGGRYSDDIEIEDAQYTDSLDIVSDETIEYIQTHYQEEMAEAWFEDQIEQSDYFEGDR